MPQFDPGTFVSQIFWLIVTFGVLYFLIMPFFLGKLGKVRDERDDKIDGDLQRAERMKLDAEALMAEYEAKLAEARANAQAVAKVVADDVNAKTSAAQAELGEQLTTQLADAEQRISQAQDAALAELESTAAELAQGVVRRLANVEIDTNAAAAAVRDAR